jgi:hypothetical protein
MTNKTFVSMIGVAALALCLTGSVHAQATVGVSTSTSLKANLSAARLPKIISNGDTAITARIAALNQLNVRVQDLKNVSAAEKANISNIVQSNITGLTALKAKLDADTDVTVAAADAKSIFGSYRIYALIIPQGYIAAAADRVQTIAGMMNTIGVKLQTRITADQTAGKNVTAMQTALTDLNAKVADAVKQAQTAQSSIATLTPDQGNKTVMASNTAALKAARADIKVATEDLGAARSDAKTIIQDLKTLGIDASASTSTSATVTQ